MLYEKNEYGYELTKESVETAITIQIEKKITYDDLENILVTALEGGINYWAGIENQLPDWNDKPKDMPLSQYALEILISGKTIKFFDTLNSDNDIDWILTLEKLLNGIKLNCQNRPDDCDINNGDALTADCIIQYALFNNIIYG